MNSPIFQLWASSAGMKGDVSPSLSNLSSLCSSPCQAGMPPRGGGWHIPALCKVQMSCLAEPCHCSGGHPSTVSTPPQADHGTETLWPGQGAQRMWPLGQTQPCPFPGPSPCMAVQANCFSKGLLCSEPLQNGYIFWSPPWDACPPPALLAPLLGWHGRISDLLTSGVSLNGSAMPPLRSCLPLV